jgi:hypothetical protein
MLFLLVLIEIGLLFLIPGLSYCPRSHQICTVKQNDYAERD